MLNRFIKRFIKMGMILQFDDEYKEEYVTGKSINIYSDGEKTLTTTLYAKLISTIFCERSEP